jgi:hypothetical protein
VEGSVGISTAGTNVLGLGFDVVGLSVGSFRAIVGTVASVSGGASETGVIVGLDAVISVGLSVTAEVGPNVGVFVGTIPKDILIDILIDIVAEGSVGISTTGRNVPGLGLGVVGLSVGSFRAIVGTVVSVSVSGAGGASEIDGIVGLDAVGLNMGAAAQSSFEAGPMPV